MPNSDTKYLVINFLPGKFQHYVPFLILAIFYHFLYLIVPQPLGFLSRYYYKGICIVTLQIYYLGENEKLLLFKSKIRRYRVDILAFNVISITHKIVRISRKAKQHSIQKLFETRSSLATLRDTKATKRFRQKCAKLD